MGFGGGGVWGGGATALTPSFQICEFWGKMDRELGTRERGQTTKSPLWEG